MKSMNFKALVKTLEGSCFLLRKGFKKQKFKSGTFYKSYSLRFIDSPIFINDSLDSSINNLTWDICNTKCKHWIKYRACRKCEKRNNDGLNGVKCVKSYQSIECVKI